MCEDNKGIVGLIASMRSEQSFARLGPDSTWRAVVVWLFCGSIRDSMEEIEKYQESMAMMERKTMGITRPARSSS